MLQVEFIDSDAEIDDDDLEVEFSAAATVRNDKKHTVNKISALTFQQIGKTESDNESYVMQSAKSWSSVVGKNKKNEKNGSRVNVNSVKSSDVDKDEGRVGNGVSLCLHDNK